MTITELGEFIRAHPGMRWTDLSPEQQDVAKVVLLPDGGFTQEQRSLLEHWWLECSQADVDAINAVLPAHVQVAAIEHGGVLYLGGDLLTDALVEGATYNSALGVLGVLKCCYFEQKLENVSEQVL